MTKNKYYLQVALLLQLLEEVNKFNCFAIKGGTAINMFVRNMPRLSIDIDLAYLPIEPRNIFLNNLETALLRLAENIKNKFPDCEIELLYTKSDRQLVRFLVKKDQVIVKIESNLVVRGTVYPSREMELCEKAQTEFLYSVDSNIISEADLYAGKICAALDRQHPRDLFDVKLLLENEGITTEIRKAFVIYLASCPRPMSELLQPNFIDISQSFNEEFLGMTGVEMSLDELKETRVNLVNLLNSSLTDEERRFLLSIKIGEPEWGLMDLKNIENLPALKWKLMNINKLNSARHLQAVDKLKEALQL